MIYKRYTTPKKVSTSIRNLIFIFITFACISATIRKEDSFWKPIEPQADSLVELIGNGKNAYTDTSPICSPKPIKP